jgi:hypothetical protein
MEISSKQINQLDLKVLVVNHLMENIHGTM